MSQNTDPERQPLVSQNNIDGSRRYIPYKVTNLLVIFIVIFVIGIGILITSTSHYVQKRNVILLISDGFGPASEAYGREFARYVGALDAEGITSLDSILVGQSRTKSSSSLVTDSAAGATAFSCGLKTYNNAVGVDPNENPCGTILEAAKAEGMLTGLVVTSRITHATPAAFSAHVLHRDMENDIALQQIGFNPLGRQVDLMFGGGECEFLPNTTQGSCRSDDRDLKREGKDAFNWNFMSKEEFEQIPNGDFKLPMAALFAKGHMSYDIDRDPKEQPSLKEMTQKALKVLSKASSTSSQGFFLMIEGSRIDMAAHDNDPAAHAREILAYYEAISAVKAFVNTHPDTVMISVSDHETGGFTLGRQIGPDYPEYIWYPEVIKRVKNSAATLANKYLNYQGDKKKSYLRQEILLNGLGIDHVSSEEWSHLQNCTTFQDFNYAFGDMVSRRAKLGWTTHGHTSVDVNLYALGPQTERLAGNRENIEIGHFISQFLDLNLDKITNRLRTKFVKPITSLFTNVEYEYGQHN